MDIAENAKLARKFLEGLSAGGEKEIEKLLDIISNDKDVWVFGKSKAEFTKLLLNPEEGQPKLKLNFSPQPPVSVAEQDRVVLIYQSKDKLKLADGRLIGDIQYSFFIQFADGKIKTIDLYIMLKDAWVQQIVCWPPWCPPTCRTCP